jgi:3-phosphoshikimate 1-carboxyvinyltransferase
VSQLTVRPGGALCGQVTVPGDKSISHRALILGAIAGGESRVTGFLPAADCQATLDAIRALGVQVDRLESSTLRVHGRGLHGLREPEDVVACARSGTTLRLLAGLLAGQPFLSVLTGDEQLRRRPMARIVAPLRRMGALILGRDAGQRPPLAVQGGALQGLDHRLPVASAQVKSALLLAGLYASGSTTVRVPGPARDHTERMLAAMGARLETVGWDVVLHPGTPLQPHDLTVPGDLSSAVFLAVAAALVPGSEVVLPGVGVNPTRSGLLDVLRVMGADLIVPQERVQGGEPVADLTVRATGLRAADVAGELVVRMIDEIPLLAVAATQAQGETVVRDAAELRVKETDRIATTVHELRRLGARIDARPDGLVVEGPVRLRGATVSSHGDHRLAMALAVAGLVAEGETTVLGADCIGDSFPGFARMLQRLGGEVTS